MASTVTYKFVFENSIEFVGICISAHDLLHRIARRTGHAQTHSIRLRMFREDGTEVRPHETVARNLHSIKRSPVLTNEPLPAAPD